MPRIVSVLNHVTELIFQGAKGGAQPTLYAALGNDIAGGDYCGPSSLWQTRGAPVKVGSNRRSRDPEAAAKLWALSEQMTGVKYLS